MDKLIKPNIHAVIFDVDWLLLNTEEIYTKVTSLIAKEYGKNYTWDIKRHVMGRSELDAAKFLVQALKLPLTPDIYLKKRNFILSKLLAECSLMVGAKDVINLLKKNKILVASATSSSRCLFDIKTKKHVCFFNLFDYSVCIDDGFFDGKPSPDIFLYATKKLKSSPENTLVLEDSISWARSALSAGMHVIVVQKNPIHFVEMGSVDSIVPYLSDVDFSLYNLVSKT